MRLLLPLLLAAPIGLIADAVTLVDGTFLRGRIERIADGQLELRVQGWGGRAPLEIPLTRVESFRTDDAVRLTGRQGAVLLSLIHI